MAGSTVNTVRVGDIDVAYTLCGEGHPLVLIQGLTATLDWWDPEFVEALSRRYRVLAFDNRGAGRTEAPEGEFTIEQLADDTAGLMDALGIESAYVLGYSLGGMIGQELALRHPEKVEKLVLCVTFCGGKNTVAASREVLSKLMDRSGSTDDLVERFLSLMFTREWMEENRNLLDGFKERYLIAPTPDHAAARQFMATVRLDTYDRLDKITAPTMVMCGADDILIPAENSRIIAGAIPGAQLKAYPGAGHGFVWQMREAVLEDLTGFLG
jgi:3-oxoadipate enol-lactonase